MLKKMMGAAVALAMLATPAVAQTTAMRIWNYSNSSDIVSVTIENEHGRSYNVISRPIPYGYNRVVDMNDGEGHNHCTYKATARFANGVYAQRTINVCTTVNWKIYDLDNTVS